MGISFDNTDDGGSVQVTINYITGYVRQGSNKQAVKNVPRKDTPTVDSDTYVVYPIEYRITALVTDAEVVLLETLKTEPDDTIVMNDGLRGNKNCKVINVTSTARPGYTDYPWLCTVQLQGEDH